MSTSDLRVEIRVNDEASPALFKVWLRFALPDDYVASALAHEGIEAADDVISRIAGDIRARMALAYRQSTTVAAA